MGYRELYIKRFVRDRYFSVLIDHQQLQGTKLKKKSKPVFDPALNLTSQL